MTTANEVDEHLGEVGTLLRRRTLDWLVSVFGKENVFVDPVGTAYLIKVTSFDSARGALARYSYEVGDHIVSHRRISEFVPWDALEKFRPQHTAFGLTLRVSDLDMARGRSGNGDAAQARRETQAAVIDETRHFLRTLAAYTTYAEKQLATQRSHEPLFTLQDLPRRGDPRYRSLEDFIDRQESYVAAGVFGLAVRPGEHRTLVENPRFRRLTGHLSRREALNGGGILQRFSSAVGAVLATSHEIEDSAYDRFRRLVMTEPADAPMLRGLGLTLNGTLGDLIEIGLAARRYAGYPALFKPMEELVNTRGGIENANFFVEEMAYRGYVDLAASENDGAKARRQAYPPKDHIDSEFQMVRQVWFDTARDMGMIDEAGEPAVIIAPFQGDCILVGFDPGSKKAETYLREVQRRVRELFKGQSFHREHKVRIQTPVAGGIHEEIRRLPIWVRHQLRRRTTEPRIEIEPTGSDGYMVSRSTPTGYAPLHGTQTITTASARLPGPLTSRAAGSGIMPLFAEMSRFIEGVLKDKRGTATLSDGSTFPLHKDGLGPLPPEEYPDPFRS